MNPILNDTSTSTSASKNGTSVSFFTEVRQIIDEARNNAVRSVDFCRVQMCWSIGRRIFEEEQQGKDRAEYGAYLIKNLAENLEPEYGSGFGYRQLYRAKQFYRLYPIVSAVRTQLNWSQYRMLIQIPDSDKREYHNIRYICQLKNNLKKEIEEIKNLMKKRNNH
ncbi:MAG: DUF1016 N-terminal domain-containing protein [Paludibacteraceae bacterium]|nr:DUF1016 N-terminal domain-containing protein [Paludibacteraceae bacterium]